MSRKYHFTGAIKAELDKFTATLSTRKDTKRACKNYLGTFLQWMEEQQLTVATVRTVDVLAFISSIKESTSRNVQNRTLHFLRLYFKWKKHPHNPAQGLMIKGGIKRHVARDLLDRKTLDVLHKNYPVFSLNDYRDKVITGLIVYQALGGADLKKLQLDDIDLTEGKVRVPGGHKMNSRTLALEGFQILELKEYMEVIRPQLMKIETSSKLFISSRGNVIKHVLSYQLKTLKKLDPKVKSLSQLRRSVIAVWLKTKDVRIVQYMAGHKKVSSTEKYHEINLEDLQEQLNQYHPLK